MEAINAFIAQYGALMAQGTWDAIVMTVLSTLFAYVIGIPVGVSARLRPSRAACIPTASSTACLVG